MLDETGLLNMFYVAFYLASLHINSEMRLEVNVCFSEESTVKESTPVLPQKPDRH